jgi:hypothetical protein
MSKLKLKYKKLIYSFACVYWKNRCAYCSRHFNPRKDGRPSRSLTLDHFFPKSSGGNGGPLNLLPVCKQCNSEKEDRPVDEFFFFRGGKRAMKDRFTSILEYFTHVYLLFPWEKGAKEGGRHMKNKDYRDRNYRKVREYCLEHSDFEGVEHA